MSVSRETSLAGQYFDILRKWNERINLMGTTIDRQLEERALDEAALLARNVRSDRCADLGSGNGLPAIPLALARPDLDLTLIESDHRKAAFLNAVRRELRLANVTVLAERIERIPPLRIAALTARAFAPLAAICRLAIPHLAPGGRLYLLKGRRADAEIEEARRAVSFDLRKTPIGEGWLLELSELGPRR